MSNFICFLQFRSPSSDNLCTKKLIQFFLFSRISGSGWFCARTNAREKEKLATPLLCRMRKIPLLPLFWSIDVKTVWSFSFQHFLFHPLGENSPFVVMFEAGREAFEVDEMQMFYSFVLARRLKWNIAKKGEGAAGAFGRMREIRARWRNLSLEVQESVNTVIHLIFNFLKTAPYFSFDFLWS